MNKIEKIQPSHIFTNYIFKSIPLAFDESMSYYETLCGVLDLLHTHTEVINNNADLLAELESYVEHYFDNLDVQEEINNKLDEMAEHGELADIIAQYLGLAGVLAYDTKADMKLAQNIANGSILKTLGDTNYNDGYGNFYKARTVTTDDVIDDDNIVALYNNTLVAEKIPNNYLGDLNELKPTGDNIVEAINDNYDNIKLTNILKNKNTIIIGDSLCLTDRWGDKFVYFSGCNGEVYGNGSAGFTSQGITEPFVDETFGDMLEDIVTSKTPAERLAVEYLIVGGGINDALNNHTPSSITTAVNNFITYAKNNLPNAKIIIFPLHTFQWLSDTELSRYTAILETCNNRGVMTTADFLFWTVDDRTYDSGDHTHLSDTGYQVLANKILSFIYGTNNVTVKPIGYTLAENWSYGSWFSMYKRDNIVYIQGILHYTGGAVSNSTKILDFDNTIYVTGSSGYNKYIPTVYYAGGTEFMSSVNVSNGALNCGRPVNYTSLNNPYLYINGSFVVGMQGNI